ncbi:MAG: hypothetical protein K8S97_08480 [Anaerolineae bacterium]|nr:hypothetical protein [Anaerolineae bacterium]
MAKPTTIKRKIATLEAERETIQARHAELVAELDTHTPVLNGARAAAGRSDAPDVLQAAQDAEKHNAQLRQLVDRKIAAAQQLERLIDDARADLVNADRREKLARLATIRTLAGDIAEKLDRQLDDRALWGTLAGLHQEGRSIAQGLNGGGFVPPTSTTGGLLFVEPSIALDNRLEAIRLMAHGRAEHVEPSTMRAALKL